MYARWQMTKWTVYSKHGKPEQKIAAAFSFCNQKNQLFHNTYMKHMYTLSTSDGAEAELMPWICLLLGMAYSWYHPPFHLPHLFEFTCLVHPTHSWTLALVFCMPIATSQSLTHSLDHLFKIASKLFRPSLIPDSYHYLLFCLSLDQLALVYSRSLQIY